jgi:hypothetical protein
VHQHQRRAVLLRERAELRRPRRITQFTIDAPLPRACSATRGDVVSIDTITPVRAAASMVPPSRAICSSSPITRRPRPRRLGADVDDVGALRDHLVARRRRDAFVDEQPPSENESGVRLSTPMTP